MKNYSGKTMKLIGLYIISFGLIIAGFVLIRKNKNNRFYIALVGCGVGSLYITLLLSDLYFKVIGDILLYAFILIWAVFVKYLTRLKSFVFHMIGQLGIFIATILGVLLCVHDADAPKLLVLTVFYFISSVVFAVRNKRTSNADADEAEAEESRTYEQNICIHLFKSLNLIVFMLGFLHMDPSTLKTVNILILMVYILAEFCFSFKEKCTHGLAYLAGFFFVLVASSSAYSLKIEYLIMLLAMYAVFLYVCKDTELTAFKMTGYLLLCLLIMINVWDTASASLEKCASLFSIEIDFISTKASLLTFFTLAVLHLILNRLEYFGKEKPVEVMMYAVNGLLMAAGCFALYESIWQIPVILITTLLFLINSKKLLQKNIYAGYYVMFKYTVLMFCILNSYDVINYLISICLLLFAIISIVVGFYKDTKSFRLYGLLLSMVSIFKLIMIDIQYDSTMENAVSFFVSGVLCFIISFIYNRIDRSFQKTE